MLNELVVVPHSDLPKLRDLYKKDENPKLYMGYQMIENYLQWLRKDPTFSEMNMYSLNGDWSDGTYLILYKWSVSISTCSDNHSKIGKLLSLVDWTKKWDLIGYTQNISKEIEDFIDQNNLHFISNNETDWYYLKKEEAIKYDIRVPKGFTLKGLSEEDAETINSLWPHRSDGSIYFIKRLIKYNPNFGIINENQELIGWILRSQLGTLAVLHVKTEYERRGFGSLLVKALSKRLAEMGDDSCATILTTNIPSLNMFKKIGFKPLDKVYFVEGVTLKKK